MEHIDMTDAAAEFIDNQGVADFADAMRCKLEKKRAEGRGGWHDPDQCQLDTLAVMLLDHLEKGDPVDIGNFAMMLYNRGDGTDGQPSVLGATFREWLDHQLKARDIVASNLQAALDKAAARIAEAAAKIPPGEPGDCDLCGEWSGRLVGGVCAPCRDRHKLP